jgi:PadR family transcriptional regulator, regulatory protein AphA
MSPLTRHPLALEYALLGFLRKGPLHGYQIHHQLSDPDGMGLIWRLKQSQLYAILARLENEGYVTSTVQVQEARPPRRIYQMTESGSTIFFEWLHTPVQHGRQVRQEFMARLYFAQKEGKEIALQLIESQRQVIQDSLRALSPGEAAKRSGAQFQDLVQMYRIQQMLNIVNWLDSCVESIDQAP